MAVIPTIATGSVSMMTPEPKRARRRRGRKHHHTASSDDSASVSSSTTSSSSSDDSSRSLNHRNSPKKKKHALSKEEQAQFVALDCEMVGVGNRNKSHIARVTIVDWDHDLVYDRFVRPSEPVTDYRTFVSGITVHDLDNENAVDIETCRREVASILYGKTLVGHALKNDLVALGIRHPWQLTRDTAKFEPFMKVRFDDGVLWPRKLKALVEEKLQREIQPIGRPHSAYEDAAAALQLYKLVRVKWEKTMEYKIQKTAQILETQQPSN